MEGHWEWSDSSGDDADTADLGGDSGNDLGHDLGQDLSQDYGGTDGGEFNTDFGGQFTDGSPSGEDHQGHQGSDDLEEPLGTEHAAEDYDQSVNAGFEPLDLPGTDQHADLTDGGPAFEHGHQTGTDGTDGTDGGGADPAQGDLTFEDGHQVDDAADGHDGGEAAFGTDPDADAAGDDPAWHDVPFPAELHLEDPPEPVDGFPWTDVNVLGGPDHDLSAAYDPASTDGHASPTDLASYDGADLPAGADPWSLLLGSEDPATSSLATFWAPQT